MISSPKPPSMFDASPWLGFRPGKRLRELRTFHEEAGVIAALHDAIYLLLQIGAPAPEWVLRGALALAQDRMQDRKSTGPGSSGNEGKAYERAMIRYWRWYTYKQVRSEGIPHLDAFAEAAERLEGTLAAAGEDAIEKSVKRVSKELKHPVTRYQYYRALSVSRELTGTNVLASKFAVDLLDPKGKD